MKAEDILDEYVKGNTAELSKKDKDYHTVTLNTCLKAMRRFAKLKSEQESAKAYDRGYDDGRNYYDVRDINK